MSTSFGLQEGTSDIVSHFATKKAQRKYWQEYQKRYQTTRQDMERAGLNPMMMFGAASVDTPMFTPPARGGGGGGGPSPLLIRAQVQQANAQTDLLRAEAAHVRSQTPAAGVFQPVRFLYEAVKGAASARGLENPFSSEGIAQLGKSAATLGTRPDDLLETVRKRLDSTYTAAPKSQRAGPVSRGFVDELVADLRRGLAQLREYLDYPQVPLEKYRQTPIRGRRERHPNR